MIKGIALYLLYGQLLPYARTAELLTDFCGCHISPGTIEAFVVEGADRLIEAEELIKQALRETDVIGHDEMGVRVQGVLSWLHVARTDLLTHYTVHRKRGKLATDEIGILPAFHGISDVTGGHFLGNTMMARRVRTMPWRASTQRMFSALTPLPILVQDLNGFQPVILGGYPSALEVLAKEQQAGRLHIHPVQISVAGETLTDATRQRITTAFGGTVSNYYGSSEAVGLTFECKWHHLHVNSDWYILEPVDEDEQPVPPGQLSHAVLVTNLANRVQPIIRYKMGDRASIVIIEKAQEPPQLHPKSGKFRQVWSEVTPH